DRAVGAGRPQGGGGARGRRRAGHAALSREHPAAACGRNAPSRPGIGQRTVAVIESDGLFDLQVNGYAGVDFNDAGITADRLDLALAAMLGAGVTGCLPTLITASEADLKARLTSLDRAVSHSRLGPQMVPGYHLEGPFLSPL